MQEDYPESMKHWTEVLMEKLRNPKSVRNFAVYFAIACIGVASNLFTATILRRQFGMGFGSSIILGYLTGMVVGFVLTKLFAFNARNSGNMKREAVKFFMVSMVALTVTWVFSELIKRLLDFWFGHYPTTQILLEALVGDISRMMGDVTGLPLSLSFVDRFLFSNLGGIGFGFFANFFGHKYFTFKQTGYYHRYVLRGKSKSSVSEEEKFLR
jgi:putative flippase GtrA